MGARAVKICLRHATRAKLIRYQEHFEAAFVKHLRISPLGRHPGNENQEGLSYRAQATDFQIKRVRVDTINDSCDQWVASNGFGLAVLR